MTTASHAAALRADALPVSILTGFLGSGKTTLLNHLLASTGMNRTAVLINEFGEVGIDQLIVRHIDPTAVLLKSGCICCTVQGALVDGLKELYMKRLAGTLPPFERVVIETTGLADPLSIVACLMRDPLFKHAYRLEGLITTADAVHGEHQLERHVEAVRQAAIADRLLITKPDLVDASVVDRLARRLAALNPNARILTALHGAVDPAQLFDGVAFDVKSRPREVRQALREESRANEHHGHDEHGHEVANVNRHDELIVSHSVLLEESVSLQALAHWYEDFSERRADHLLRMKGIVNARGSARPFVVHGVHATYHPPAQLPAWPDEDRRSRIVFITSDLAGSEIEASLRGYLAQWKEKGPAPEQALPTHGIWLNDAELTRMFSALAGQEDWVAANALRLMLLTGASCDEARTARWDELDLEARLWRKTPRAASNARPRRISLGGAALLLLEELSGEGEAAAGFLFPCAGGEIPRSRLESVWRGAAAAAGVEHRSLDALRPVLGSRLFDGLPLALTRRLLGLSAARRRHARTGHDAQ